MKLLHPSIPVFAIAIISISCVSCTTLINPYGIPASASQLQALAQQTEAKQQQQEALARQNPCYLNNIADGSIWVTNGIDCGTASYWEALTHLDAATAVPWAKAGFTALTVLPWINAGFNVQEALLWQTEPWASEQPRKAAEWKNAGFTPQQATPWVNASINVETALTWHRAGIPDTDAATYEKSMTQHEGNSLEWYRAGFSADAAQNWILVGVPSPQAAKQWAAAGFSYDDHPPWSNYFTLQEAKRARFIVQRDCKSRMLKTDDSFLANNPYSGEGFCFLVTDLSVFQVLSRSTGLYREYENLYFLDFGHSGLPVSSHWAGIVKVVGVFKYTAIFGNTQIIPRAIPLMNATR